MSIPGLLVSNVNRSSPKVVSMSFLSCLFISPSDGSSGPSTSFPNKPPSSCFNFTVTIAFSNASKDSLVKPLSVDTSNSKVKFPAKSSGNISST